MEQTDKSNTPTEQGEYKVGNKRPPLETRFGGPRANPRHNGAWKKEDTARYKLEKMITMSDKELTSIIETPEAPEFEKSVADIILSIRVDTDKDGNKIPAHQRFKAVEGLINQVYGQPAQRVLSKESEETDEQAFIKGYLLT